MAESKQVRVGVNGYGVIGKRVAAAVAQQNDMTLAGVADVVTDWRAQMVLQHRFPLFGATADDAATMRGAGLEIAGTPDDLLSEIDVVVDCTPKRIAARNVDAYRSRGIKYILQGATSTQRPATPSSPNATMPAHSARTPLASSPATRHPSCGRSRR